ncbi:MAG: quinone oxidoreductase [Kordiimonas sp.]|nr:quinone oxidoreductase [Kordiimonas sp.]
MVMAMRVHEYGGPSVFVEDDIQVGRPGPGEIRMVQTVVGLNMIDTYMRKGLYPMELPGIVGSEAAGVVDAVGEGVNHIAVGDRVAYTRTGGAYVGVRVMPADQVVKIPDDITDEMAAVLMLKGLTAHMLLRQIYAIRPGDTILFYAAAGGLGSLACPWARALGARVIGVVGSEEKIDVAREYGCAEVLVFGEDDIVASVRELTDGDGVPVVYDSLGKDSFDISLDCLALRGTMVTFGNATGPVPPVSPLTLMRKGSITLIRPMMTDYFMQRRELERACNELFQAVRTRAVPVNIQQRYPLREASRAHADLESRKTTGASVLMV